ncbi:hypothetical protein Scep_019977 [Stephania cephalantha]|uniref:Uncharacterized protein n=1 Tax=Stephania cephalantha TaxID=152367 RepID=A0AAP0IC84_9MAGN
MAKSILVPYIVVANNNKLSDDDAGGVVEDDAAVEASGGVDVDGEDVGDARVEGEGARRDQRRWEMRWAWRCEEALVVEEAAEKDEQWGRVARGAGSTTMAEERRSGLCVKESRKRL